MTKINTGKPAGDHDFGKVDFFKIAPLMGGVSIVLTIIAVALLFTKGLNYGIDFAGGTEMQVKFASPINTNELRQLIDDAGFKHPVVQTFGDQNEYLIRTESVAGANE